MGIGKRFGRLCADGPVRLLFSLEDRLPNDRGEDIALRDTIRDRRGRRASVEKREVRKPFARSDR